MDNELLQRLNDACTFFFVPFLCSNKDLLYYSHTMAAFILCPVIKDLVFLLIHIKAIVSVSI